MFFDNVITKHVIQKPKKKKIQFDLELLQKPSTRAFAVYLINVYHYSFVSCYSSLRSITYLRLLNSKVILKKKILINKNIKKCSAY